MGDNKQYKVPFRVSQIRLMRKEICTLINWDQHSECERISYTGQKPPTNWHIRGKAGKRLEQPGAAQHHQSPGGDRDGEGEHPSPEPTGVTQQVGTVNQVLGMWLCGAGACRGVTETCYNASRKPLCSLTKIHVCTDQHPRVYEQRTEAVLPWPGSGGRTGDRPSESAIFCSASKLCHRKGPLGWGRTYRSIETSTYKEKDPIHIW